MHTRQHLAEAERLAQALPPLLVEAQRIAATVMLGVHGRKRAGPGESFWQYRPYSFGDSVSRVDWHKSARSDRVFIRENEWEAANTLLLWVAHTPSMSFQSALAPVSKRQRADLALLALAALALQAQERVGLIGDHVAPSHSRAALRRLAGRLDTQDSPALPTMARPPRFASAVMIGDFYEPSEAVAAALAPFAEAGMTGHLVQVSDPAEETLPWPGRVEFREISGSGRFLAGKVPALRGAYASELAAHREALRELCRRLGWSFTVHRTDSGLAPLLLALHELIGGGRAQAFGAVRA